MMGGQTNEFGLYLQAIKSRFWLVLLLAVIAVGAAYWTVGRRSTAYTASAVMMVTAPIFSATPAVGPGSSGSFTPRQETVIADILALIDSRPIALRVARRLELQGPEVVERAIRAAPERGTSLIRLSATARNPERAAALANTTAEEFIAYFREANRGSLSEVRRFVEEQMTLSRARLEQSERTLQAFRENRRIVSITDATSSAMSGLRAAELDLETATRARQEAGARLAAVRQRLSREQPLIMASRATTENPVFRQVQTHLVGLEIRRSELAQIYTPAHPRMDAIAREIADVRNRLLAEARTTIGEEVTTTNPIHGRLLGEIVTLEVERAALGARVEAIQYTMQRRVQEVRQMPSAETEYNRLQRENRILEGNYTMLSGRYQEILLRENEAGFMPASLQLIEAAAPPVRSDPSAFPRFGAAAGVAGLVLGMLGALLLEAMDDRIRSVGDAERALGVPVLAQIPSHGQPPRTVPAPAVFVLLLLLIAGATWVAVARGHVAMPGRISDGIRDVTTSVVSRVGFSQPSGMGLTTDSR